MIISDVSGGMVKLHLHPMDCFDLARVLELAQEQHTRVDGDQEYRQLEALQSMFEVAGALAHVQSNAVRVPSAQEAREDELKTTADPMFVPRAEGRVAAD